MPGSDLNDSSPSPAQPGHELSPLLSRAGFRHAFFTRLGGVSSGSFQTLSFSTAVGDDPLHVAENLRRAGALLGVSEERILYLSQVHGCHVHVCRSPAVRSHTITLEGDAIGGAVPNHAYAVRSADCVPVLVADDQSGAVMAIHAGWRGIVRGVVEAGVASLREGAGTRARLLAAIGPHISGEAFEVSEEVASELAAVCPGSMPPAFVKRPGGRAKPHVDLRLIVTRKLLELGLEPASIDHVGGCTLREPERYFSFRRDGKQSGRHLSAIVPRS